MPYAQAWLQRDLDGSMAAHPPSLPVVAEPEPLEYSVFACSSYSGQCKHEVQPSLSFNKQRQQAKCAVANSHLLLYTLDVPENILVE